MKIEDIEQELYEAQRICAPDEYLLRQRKLLYALAEYLIARDKPVLPIKEEEEKGEENDS